jgi:alpha-methylacyl-CoA racemase
MGQVVDAAITDGVAHLLAMHYGFWQAGVWELARGRNITDGGAPFYDVYETSDGEYVSVGAVESKFYLELVRRLGLEVSDLPPQNDRAGWGRLRERLSATFKTRTRNEWCAILEGGDACFAPVLNLREATLHPHNVARKTHVDLAGVLHPAPAPRFSGTPSDLRKPPPAPGEDTDSALATWGFSQEEVMALRQSAVIN